MAILPPSEWKSAKAIAQIGYVNPFLPERIALEREALGGRVAKRGQTYLQHVAGAAMEELFPNFTAIRNRAEALLDKMTRKKSQGESFSDDESQVFQDLVLYILYARYMSNILDDSPGGQLAWRSMSEIASRYEEFLADYRHYLLPAGAAQANLLEPEVVFAGLYQVERAFVHIFRKILGGSEAAAHLRAAVWRSIFTNDMRRYKSGLYRKLATISTLITGPTGTGKELVAEAIARSSFIPFDSKACRFQANPDECFIALHLAAISPTLLEAELFGFARGTFTGADRDRAGYLDAASAVGASSLFLDEIGELDSPAQVKLLRVLQTRKYQRVGETKSRTFERKVIAATNRDLDEEIEQGRFREDLYYRLCGDQIQTPSLREQLQSDPSDLRRFVRHLAAEILSESEEGAAGEQMEALTEEAVDWIEQELGEGYPWPGNVRELEQCLRSIIIRGAYTPKKRTSAVLADGDLPRLFREMTAATLTKDELLVVYASLTRAQSVTDEETATRLGVTRRTVRQWIDRDLVEQYRQELRAMGGQQIGGESCRLTDARRRRRADKK